MWTFHHLKYTRLEGQVVRTNTAWNRRCRSLLSGTALSLYDNRITPIIITDITGRRNVRIQNPYTCTTCSDFVPIPRLFPMPRFCVTLDNLKELVNLLNPVRSKWYAVGLQLSVPVSDLNSIRSQFSDPRECLCEMLQLWLKRQGVSWIDIFEALRSQSVGEEQLGVELLQEKFGPIEKIRMLSLSAIVIIACPFSCSQTLSCVHNLSTNCIEGLCLLSLIRESGMALTRNIYDFLSGCDTSFILYNNE